MKIFDSSNTCWDNKVNFVDENNVYFGYDMSGQCCENYGWYINDEISLPKTWDEFDKIHKNSYQNIEEINKELNDFVFDTSYFKEHIAKPGQEDFFSCSFIAITLRIINKDRQKYIHVYNCHDGYYAHGFEFKINEIVVKEGKL